MYQPVPELEEGVDRKESLELLDKDSIEVTLLQVGLGRKSVPASPSWTVRQFKEKYFPKEVKEEKRIRIIFQGKLLQDEPTLESLGIADHAFLHVSICENSPGIVNNPEDENHNANLGGYGDLNDAEIPPWLLQAHFARQGSNGDFVLGFIMGFFLGVLTLIWVWQRAVPRRQKLGIMLGFGCNLLLSFIQVANQHHPAPGHPPTGQDGVGK
mmetsp:Transcript_6037/g.14578  ORF Transcript_6037/g.14578 Transcript_6037/m.14578 type:complete len:212 (+) Transcript_6037:221-856(+)|eukprot:CAMPEP_0114519496 /NCGR_PEP_ID=MMETSP0109-20121206/19041_1 /TAXON_ID=29199 /ORGANISM="Chlorarachnion reptans, Strain CCCM449" /LENGTH=211 /DNA_ID=CAMNT_0001700253 /DNA_START=229 /DNA_END=864 /DNA_ORIENTATION=+